MRRPHAGATAPVSDPVRTRAGGRRLRTVAATVWPWTIELERWSTSLLLYSLFAFVCCGLNLGGFGLISMEGMVVEGGRTMLASGEWSTPHLYGEIYTFKPAFAYWLSAAAQALHGNPPEWLLRLPFAASGGLAGLVILILVGRTLNPRVALFAAMASVGGVILLEKVRLAEFDAPLAAGVFVAVAAASCSLARPTVGVGLWVVSYLGLAIGFLAKGAPALMAFAPGLLLAAILAGRLRRLFDWRHLLGLGTFLAIGTGYLAWAIAASGRQIFDQPLREVGWRTAWSLEAAMVTVSKPLLIAVAFLPWSLVLAFAGPALRLSDPRSRLLLRSGLGFAAGGTLAFCAVPAHEMRYYLPLGAGIAIAAAVILDAFSLDAPPPRLLRRAVLVTFAVTAVLTPLTAWHLRSPGLPLLLLTLAAIGAGILLAPDRSSPPTLLVATSLLLAVTLAYVWAPHRAVKRDLAGVAAELGEHLPADVELWIEGPAGSAGKHASLLYYLDRRVRTYAPGEPLPAGAFVLLALPPASCEPAHDCPQAAGTTTLGEVEHPYFDYRLVRVDPTAP